MIRQLSIFAENKKGAMHQVTQVLADANINMNTLVTNDSALVTMRFISARVLQASRSPRV